ncbi:MAG: SMP-30/gluconolactonase/LRE family protein [Pseudonocardia sp.]|nr:SMP-30/gluconolactonase/LRE family protein [Pseudonocardia sp.]
MDILLEHLAFPESPRWYDGRLWLADWGAGEALTVDAAGRREIVAALPSFPSCLDFLTDGRLLLVDADRGRLLAVGPEGPVQHADLSELSEHPWNEVVVDAQDRAYVDNIGFAFPDGEPGDPAPGTIALVGPDGAARTVAEGLMFPNGMALTPDGGTLLVAESYASRISAFTVAPDGGLGTRRTWADLGDGVPDGICLDATGALWYADVPHRRAVRVAAGGEVLARIELDRGCFSCALGGPDGRTLFLVANRWGEEAAEPAGRVLTVRVPVAGADPDRRRTR